jgi:hypothetical protein
VLSFEGFLRRRERLAEEKASVPSEMESPFTRERVSSALTPKQIVHRQTMLGHLHRHDGD